jgi:hypothetical protein
MQTSPADQLIDCVANGMVPPRSICMFQTHLTVLTGAESVVTAGTLSNDIQPASEPPAMSSYPNVAEQMASGSGNTFSDGLTAVSITSAVDMSHGMSRSSNYFETPLFSDQTTSGFSCSRTEYGSKAPVMYLDTVFGSKAPAMYLDTAFGSKAPTMYPDAAFGSKAPVMYPGTTFGSVSAQYERSSQTVTRIDMQQNDGMSPYEGSVQAPGASGYG